MELMQYSVQRLPRLSTMMIESEIYAILQDHVAKRHPSLVHARHFYSLNHLLSQAVYGEENNSALRLALKQQQERNDQTNNNITEN